MFIKNHDKKSEKWYFENVKKSCQRMAINYFGRANFLWVGRLRVNKLNISFGIIRNECV